MYHYILVQAQTDGCAMCPSSIVYTDVSFLVIACLPLQVAAVLHATVLSAGAHPLCPYLCVMCYAQPGPMCVLLLPDHEIDILCTACTCTSCSHTQPCIYQQLVTQHHRTHPLQFPLSCICLQLHITLWACTWASCTLCFFEV